MTPNKIKNFCVQKKIMEEITLITKCLICQQTNALHGIWCDKCWRGYCEKCYKTLRSRICEKTAEIRKYCEFCTADFDKKCSSCQNRNWNEVCECNLLCKCYYNAVQTVKNQYNVADFVLGEVYNGEIQLFCTTCCPKSFVLL